MKIELREEGQLIAGDWIYLMDGDEDDEEDDRVIDRRRPGGRWKSRRSPPFLRLFDAARG